MEDRLNDPAKKDRLMVERLGDSQNSHAILHCCAMSNQGPAPMTQPIDETVSLIWKSVIDAVRMRRNTVYLAFRE